MQYVIILTMNGAIHDVFVTTSTPEEIRKLRDNWSLDTGMEIEVRVVGTAGFTEVVQ